jgi:hypothetical protein
LHAFLELAKIKNFRNVVDETACQSPSNLNGTLLKNLDLQDMGCDEGKISSGPKTRKENTLQSKF